MPYDPEKHHRRSIRIKGYDYTQSGAYFITLCTKFRECLFGDVIDDGVVLNEIGNIVEETWHWLESQYVYVNADTYVIMPNHFHGILRIEDTSPMIKRKSLGRIVGAFKTVSTKAVNILNNDTDGTPLWQRSYYEHIIRDDKDYATITKYIEQNPARWTLDRDHPQNFSPPS